MFNLIMGIFVWAMNFIYCLTAIWKHKGSTLGIVWAITIILVSLLMMRWLGKTSSKVLEGILIILLWILPWISCGILGVNPFP